MCAARTMQPGQSGAGYAAWLRSRSVAHMHGLSVCVEWKKKATCVGAWNAATTTCARRRASLGAACRLAGLAT